MDVTVSWSMPAGNAKRSAGKLFQSLPYIMGALPYSAVRITGFSRCLHQDSPKEAVNKVDTKKELSGVQTRKKRPRGRQVNFFVYPKKALCRPMHTGEQSGNEDNMKPIIKIASVLALLSVGALQAEKLPVYNETLNYSVTWKGVTVGSVNMKTSTNEKNQIRSYAKVNSWNKIQGIYYVQGSFGTIWNYETQKPVYAFEEVYQGDTWQKRAFKFSGANFTIEKHEKKFSETSYPHKGAIKSDKKSQKTKATNNHLDLLGAFYYVRSLGRTPSVGETLHVPVLPAGNYQTLVLNVLGKKKISTPVGEREVLHVRSALASQGKEGLFFQTDTEIEMYITADRDSIPVHMWTDLPVLGRVDIKLSTYTQP